MYTIINVPADDVSEAAVYWAQFMPNDTSTLYLACAIASLLIMIGIYVCWR